MLPIGTITYSLGTPPVTGKGVSWSWLELKTAVKGPLAAVVYDDTGIQALTSLLSELPDTGFTVTNVQATLTQSGPTEGWRVGEALAECYLVHHRACNFPWPDGRDVRKIGSSLPGADLVGFHQKGSDHQFALGEVKTSSDNQYPPGACYGTTGFKKQLEDLRDNIGIRDDLVRYLGHRAVNNAPWKQQFMEAAVRYFADKNDIQIFGLLVRDVDPHQDDLRTRVKYLAKGCPARMAIELLAIYLPKETIPNLCHMVTQSRKKGGS